MQPQVCVGRSTIDMVQSQAQYSVYQSPSVFSDTNGEKYRSKRAYEDILENIEEEIYDNIFQS